jgi:hypothetical protein
MIVVFSSAPIRRGAAILALALGAAGCSQGSDGAGAADGGACASVYAAQLDGFRSWTSFSYDGGAQGDPSSFVVSHIAGPRTEYINAMPPPGSHEFPNGTIIVKEVGANDPPNHHLFTMEKRGCGFNAGGASGWTWMEIVEAPPGATILWQGAEPPAGESYSVDGTSCNECHKGCAANDFVCSPKIRLGGT